MLRTPHERLERILFIGAISYISIALLMWLYYPFIRGHEETLFSNVTISFVLVILGFSWFFFFIITILILPITILTWRHRIKAIVLLLIITFSFLIGLPIVRSNTMLGIIVLGGFNQWVEKACAANSDKESLRCINIILLAENEHGGAIACQAIEKHCSLPKQKHILKLLSINPPQEYWRGYFERYYQSYEERHDKPVPLNTGDP